MPHVLLYGGTFDPVHNGHLITCRKARELLAADEVLLVPARISPHKTRRPASDPLQIASSEQRLAMLELAIAGEPGFRVDPRELRRDGPSYTVDTLQELAREQSTGIRRTLLIGADQLPQFHTWRQVEIILQLCEVAVMPRPNIDLNAGLQLVHEKLRGKGEQLEKRVHAIQTPMIDISATEIRQRVNLGNSIRYLVPETVAQYLHRHGLYRTPGSL